MHTEQKVWSNWSLRQQNYLLVLLWGPFLWGPQFGQTYWTCLNPPLLLSPAYFFTKWWTWDARKLLEFTSS